MESTRRGFIKTLTDHSGSRNSFASAPSASQLSESGMFEDVDEAYLAAFDESMSKNGYDPECSNENISPDTIPAPSQKHRDTVDGLDLRFKKKLAPQSIYENTSESPRQSTMSLGTRKAVDVSSSRTSRPAKRKNPTAIHEPFIIAYSGTLQSKIDERHLSWGVQYALARLITLGLLECETLTDSVLDSLVGPSSKAARLPELLFTSGEKHDHRTFAREFMVKSPWAELDREEEALKKNPFAGLGFNECGERTDYGGKVDFSGVIKLVDGQLHIKLSPPSLGPSCRFKRRLGSPTFLHLKPSQEVQKKSYVALQNLVAAARPFVVFGSVFRPFYAKDRNLFFLKTNETYNGSEVSVSPSSTNMSLGEFINWVNPPELNTKQLLPKYAARIALGLSTSVPGISLKPADISIIPDKLSPEGSDLTDGCGYANKCFFILLYHLFKWSTFAVAIQMRVGGNKGILLLHPTDTSDWPRIWLRPSQTKIRFPQPPDPANLIVDVLRPSYLKTPARLAPDTLINLGENGVSSRYFLKLFRNSLDELITSFTDWDGSDSMLKLWHTIAVHGGVLSKRKTQDVAGEARAKGYVDRKFDTADEDEPDVEQNPLETRSIAWWTDETSGCPSSLWECTMALISGGMTPQNCQLLRDKLRLIIETTIKVRCNSYHYPVPMSCSGIIIPDPCDVLEANEIQIRSSQSDLPMPDGLTTNVILGDVLFTRHPCTLPTGIRKFRAVDRPELRLYEGVIICSVRGPRRQVEIVDGDYDGDVAEVFWDPDLVASFKNAPLTAHPSIDDQFTSNTEEVSEFLNRTASLSLDARVFAMHGVLMDALQDSSPVGIYSIIHDHAIYTLGYDDQRTMYLGRMKNEVLDRRKHGGKVIQAVFTKDREMIRSYSAPKWKNLPLMGNDIRPSRPERLGLFIMDRLQSRTKKEKDAKLAAVQKLFTSLPPVPVNSNLTAPWLEAWEKAEEEAKEEEDLRASITSLQAQISSTTLIPMELQRSLLEKIIPLHKEGSGARRLADLRAIKQHVCALFERFWQNVRDDAKKKEMNKSDPIETRQDKVRMLSKEFASIAPVPGSPYSEREFAQLRASYAYLYDTQQPRRGQFPWAVAMGELTEIQCRALGSSKTVTGDFNEHMFVKLW